MPHRFTARHSLSVAAQLDAGLRVHVASSDQRSIFAGAENLSLGELTAEVAEMLGSLRVRSFRIRAELEEVTLALQHNIECGFWLWARRAALDLAGILASCANRRLADAELSIRGMNAALRIADLIVEAATLSEEADLVAQSFEDRTRA
jgi:hypothetical protein